MIYAKSFLGRGEENFVDISFIESLRSQREGERKKEKKERKRETERERTKKEGARV